MAARVPTDFAVEASLPESCDKNDVCLSVCFIYPVDTIGLHIVVFSFLFSPMIFFSSLDTSQINLVCNLYHYCRNVVD